MRIAPVLAVVLCVASQLRGQFQSNNECATPTPLEIGVNPFPPFGQNGSAYANTLASNSANFSAGYCAPIANDVFFSLTPTCTGNIRVSLCTPPGMNPGTIADSVLEIYPFAACAGGGAPLACNDDACGLLSEVVFAGAAGASYLVRVGSYGATAAGTFHLTAVPIDLPNDSCAGALPLVAGPNAGSTVCASPSAAPACSGFPAGASDAWHSFTPTTNCAFSVALTGDGADALAVYGGSCSNLTPLACLNGAPPLQTSTFLGAAGTTYYVRVGETEFNGIGGFGPYTIDLQCFAAAGSDECAGAAPVFDGVNPGAPNGLLSLGFDNNGATTSGAFASACGLGGYHDVFFQYTATTDGEIAVSTCSPGSAYAPTNFDTVLAVYPASACPNGGVAPLACNDDWCGLQSRTTFVAAYGETYLIRVASYSSGATGGFYLSIDPSLNETCATAQLVAAGTTHGTTALALADGTAGACAVGASVWYRFVATENGLLKFTPNAPPGTVFSLLLSDSSGGCGNLGTAGCSVNGEAITQENYASPSSPAVWYLEAFTPAPASPGPFAFHFEVVHPPNDTCATAIPVFEGINPGAPFGVNGSTYSNVGAYTDNVDASGAFCGIYENYDVYFSYFAAASGPTTVSIAVPPGFIGTYSGGRVAVFTSLCPVSTLIACDSSGTASFDAIAGSTYLIEVSSNFPFFVAADPSIQFEFYLTVTRPFRLTMDAPAGPGSFRVQNTGGQPSAPCLSFFTVYPGAYPNGGFFGIDPTLFEILAQLAVPAPPFLNFLDTYGNSSFGPLTGAPSGLTVYAVSVPLNGLYQLGAPTPPTQFTIP